MNHVNYIITISLGARWAPTSSWRPFVPAFCPSGIFDFVLCTLQVLRPCDPRTDYNYNFYDHHHPDTTMINFILIVIHC